MLVSIWRNRNTYRQSGKQFDDILRNRREEERRNGKEEYKEERERKEGREEGREEGVNIQLVYNPALTLMAFISKK
jgi:hypothetical protein